MADGRLPVRAATAPMVMERSGLDINLTLTTTLRLMTKSIDIACTLGVADLAAQGRRWQRLMARALTARDETPDGLRLTFRRSEEHTSELQSRFDLVCRLLLEKNNNMPVAYVLLLLLN